MLTPAKKNGTARCYLFRGELVSSDNTRRQDVGRKETCGTYFSALRSKKRQILLFGTHGNPTKPKSGLFAKVDSAAVA